jgi:hypothetical protein
VFEVCGGAWGCLRQGDGLESSSQPVPELEVNVTLRTPADDHAPASVEVTAGAATPYLKPSTRAGFWSRWSAAERRR